VEALRHADASVVLFLEHAPETLDAWLRRHFAADAHTAGAAFADALHQIISATTWMRAHGLLHLDVHPQNILLSEGRLLFTDFGLSMHRSFELDHDELAFYATHGNYDHDAGVTSLLHWTLAELGAGSRSQRLTILHAAAVDGSTEALGGVRARLRGAAALIGEHATTAIAVTEMFDLLMTNAATASYGSRS
jgi:serine/threonine protein kinase